MCGLYMVNLYDLAKPAGGSLTYTGASAVKFLAASLNKHHGSPLTFALVANLVAPFFGVEQHDHICDVYHRLNWLTEVSDVVKIDYG